MENLLLMQGEFSVKNLQSLEAIPGKTLSLSHLKNNALRTEGVSAIDEENKIRRIR